MAALMRTMIHNRVNGKSVNHVTQPDGTVNHNDDIKSTTNDQLNEQIDQKVEQNEEVVPKCFNPSSRSTSAIHEPKVERRPFDDKLSELVDDSSKIREQKYDDKPLNKESESRNLLIVDLVVLVTVELVVLNQQFKSLLMVLVLAYGLMICLEFGAVGL
ncbi:hypothetical protein Tco_0551551 [Tanacetum coccineum]